MFVSLIAAESTSMLGLTRRALLEATASVIGC